MQWLSTKKCCNCNSQGQSRDEKACQEGKRDSHSRAAVQHYVRVQLAFCFLHLESQFVADKQHTLHLWPVHKCHVVSHTCHVRSSSSTGVLALKPCLIYMYVHICKYVYIHIHTYIYIYWNTWSDDKIMRLPRVYIYIHIYIQSYTISQQTQWIAREEGVWEWVCIWASVFMWVVWMVETWVGGRVAVDDVEGGGRK